MLKRDITYKDLDGDTITKTFYFNLNEAELVELEMSHLGGITGFVERVSQTEDVAKMIKEFKRIILMCYGIREGDSFIKTDELRHRFEGNPAFSALFMEFLQKPGSLEDFIKGVIPQTPIDIPEVVSKPTIIPGPPLPAATVEAGHQIIEHMRETE